MRNSFATVIPHVLKHEGGYVDHPKDPGGATNKGVTLATFRRFIKPGGTKSDLRKLTTDQAAHCYKKFYWDRVSGDDLPAGVDYAVFDFAVNSGPSRAAKYLQKLVGAVADGVIGPATIAACSKVSSENLVNGLCDARLAFMKRIRGGSLWKTFGRGWSARVSDVRKLSVKLSRTAEPDAPPIPAPRPMPSPEKVEAKLRESGSRTIENADQVKRESWLAKALTFVSGGGLGIATYFEQFAAMPPMVLMALIVAVTVVILVLLFRNSGAATSIIGARVDDAVTGKNTSRIDEGS